MVYVLLAPGFEESEAVVPTDLLRQAGLETALVSLSGPTVCSNLCSNFSFITQTFLSFSIVHHTTLEGEIQRRTMLLLRPPAPPLSASGYP